MVDRQSRRDSGVRGDRTAGVTEEELRRSHAEFLEWMDGTLAGSNMTAISEALGLAANTLYSARERIWTAHGRSMYWVWRERRRELLRWSAADVRERRERYRKGAGELGVSVRRYANADWSGELAALVQEVEGERNGVEDETPAILSEPETVSEAARQEGERGQEESPEVLQPHAPAADLGISSAGDTSAAVEDEVGDTASRIPEGAIAEDDAREDAQEAAVEDAVSGEVGEALAEVTGAQESIGDSVAARSSGTCAATAEGTPEREQDRSEGYPAWVSGSPPTETLAAMSRGEREILDERIASAETVEEIAHLCGAPILTVVPDITLDMARRCARLRLSGWHPSRPRRDENGEIGVFKVASTEGLWGDGPFALYYGLPADYKNKGALVVALAPQTTWGPHTDLVYSALQMRTGVTIAGRRGKYALASHHDRPLHLGYRLANWAPKVPYPDHDWFFGSEGFVSEKGVRMPSRAKLLGFWYLARSMRDAYAGTEAEGTAFYYELEHAVLRTERKLLSDEYETTLYYHGRGRILGAPTRVAERRWMGVRLLELEELAHKERRRMWRRRLLKGLALGWYWALRRRRWRRKYKKLREHSVLTEDDVVEPESDGGGANEGLSTGGVADEIGVPVDAPVRENGMVAGETDTDGEFDWEGYHDEGAYVDVARCSGSLEEGSVVGLDYTEWRAYKVAWESKQGKY